MEAKWKIYLICLFSYSTIHAIRTLWSALKSDLKQSPFQFSISFLGTLDMLVLFILALSMNLLGSKIEVWGVKRTVLIAMAGLAVVSFLLGLFLTLGISSPWIYVVFFSFGVGILSSVGWPSCLCMVSYHFGKKDAMALSAYNGTSQTGDFISLMTYFFVKKLTIWSSGVTFFFSSAYLLVFLFIMGKFINNNEVNEKEMAKQNKNPQQLNEEPEKNANIYNQLVQVKIIDKNNKSDEGNEVYQAKDINPSIVVPEKSSQVIMKPTVNFLTVWKLPGVALNVLAYGFIKSVNAFIVGWLVYYLLELDLGPDAILMTILWSAAVFSGGITSAYFNKKYSKDIFIFQLLISAGAFFFLEEFHNKIYEIRIMIFLMVCGFAYGGPYNLMSTAIPLVLGSKKTTLQYSNGKGMIISLMQGYGQLFCGISLLLVPLFQVHNIHAAGAAYCFAAMLLLFIEKRRQENNCEAHQITVHQNS